MSQPAEPLVLLRASFDDIEQVQVARKDDNSRDFKQLGAKNKAASVSPAASGRARAARAASDH
jgi:hypothetical protein